MYKLACSHCWCQKLHAQTKVQYLNVTVFWKTDRMDTNTEIHFLLVDESHTHALFRDTKHLRLDGRVCFYRRLFSDAVKPLGCLSWPLWPLMGINKTAWAAKLILTTCLAYPVSCAGLGHILMVKHCPLSLNFCFIPPTAPHPPPPPTPPPSHPPTHPPPIDSIRVITEVKKNHPKNQGHTNS